MKPDTNIGGKIAAVREVFNEKEKRGQIYF